MSGRLSLPFGTFFGARLRLSPALLLLLAAGALTGQLASFAGMLALVLFHELCHAAAARAVGVEVLEIELSPIGGAARVGSEVEIMPTREIAVALAGPAGNMLLVFLAILADRYFFLPPPWIASFLSANFLLIGINLIPALPLDGGRVLRALLGRALGMKRATRVASALGCATGIALLGLGAYGAVRGIWNVTYFTCGLFLVAASAREYRRATTLHMRDLTLRPRALRADGSLPVRQIAVRADMPLWRVVGRFRPRSYHRVILLDENLAEKGEVSEERIRAALLQYGSAARIGDLVRLRRGRRP